MAEQEAKRKILVPLAPSFEEIEALTVVDLFRRIGADVTVSSILPKSAGLVVKGTNGIQVVCDNHLEDVADVDFDLISLPGGVPGADHLSDCKLLIAKLEQQRQNDRYYAAICASPYLVFQKHGFLNEQVAGTCHPGYYKKLLNKSRGLEDVVVNGKCITSRGAATTMDYTIAMMRLLYSEQKVLEVLRRIVYKK